MHADHRIKCYAQGFSLLEMLVALALSAILLLVIDKLMVSLWVTRNLLEKAQESERLRNLPIQLFSASLFHAGNLGCRAIKDGIEVKTPAQIPEIFFIHLKKAIKLEGNTLLIHETLDHQMTLNQSIEEGEMLSPEGFLPLSDWILISDCERAELIHHGGRTTQVYQPPVTVSPVVITRWSFKNKTVSRQQVYPAQPSQPVVSEVEGWGWKAMDKLIELRWKIDGIWEEYLFELGNTSCC